MRYTVHCSATAAADCKPTISLAWLVSVVYILAFDCCSFREPLTSCKGGRQSPPEGEGDGASAGQAKGKMRGWSILGTLDSEWNCDSALPELVSHLHTGATVETPKLCANACSIGLTKPNPSQAHKHHHMDDFQRWHAVTVAPVGHAAAAWKIRGGVAFGPAWPGQRLAYPNTRMSKAPE